MSVGLVMKCGTLLVAGLLSSGLVNGYQCNKDEYLKKYKLSQGNGLGFVSGSIKRDTPPSTTEDNWWINVCSENDKNDMPEECNRNDVLCGITYVTVPGKDKLLTQEIEFSHDLSGPVEESDKLRLNLKGRQWGSETFDAQLDFECDDNLKTDEITSSTIQDKQIRISVKGPSGCLIKKEDGDGDKDKEPPQKDPAEARRKRTSWFTWLLLYALLFTLIYLMVTAYVNTRGGSFQDFREEFIERSTQLITSLPAFAKEVTARIFGSGSSQRGGYSAV